MISQYGGDDYIDELNSVNINNDLSPLVRKKETSYLDNYEYL
jgi:hypothetical protein